MAKISELLSDRAVASDHLSATTTRQGRLVGFSESEDRGRSATGDLNEDGTVTIEVMGAAPKGEEGAMGCCFRLIEAKRKKGELWADPVEISGEAHIDASAAWLVDSSVKLKIQVVRALVDQAFWSSLGREQFTSIRVEPKIAAELLQKSIELKIGRIPLGVRRETVLLLDATDVPGLVLTDVVEEFHKQYLAWCKKQGFAEVWITGPWQEMTHKLCCA